MNPNDGIPVSTLRAGLTRLLVATQRVLTALDKTEVPPGELSWTGHSAEGKTTLTAISIRIGKTVIAIRFGTAEQTESENKKENQQTLFTMDPPPQPYGPD